MRADYKKYVDRTKPLAGKIILRPETPEEHQAQEEFKSHIGSKQKGRKLEVIYRWRDKAGKEDDQKVSVLDLERVG